MPSRNAMAGPVGAAAERTARSYLERRGLRLLASNYRTRRGEIDLIMADRGTIAFVEVKFRAGAGPVAPHEAVDAHKQRRLAAAAAHYLSAHPRLQGWPCRFDVVTVAGTPDGRDVRWIRGAFDT